MSPPPHPRGASQRGHGGVLMLASCPSSSTGRRNSGEKVFSGRRRGRVKSGCARTRGEDAAQHLTQVLCQSKAVSLDRWAAGAAPGAGSAEAGAEGTAAEMLHTEAVTA